MTETPLFISHENCLYALNCDIYVQLLPKAYSSHAQTSHAVTAVWCVICPACPIFGNIFCILYLSLIFHLGKQSLTNWFFNKTFSFTFSFNSHSLIKRALLHFVPFDCQSAGLIAVQAVLPFLQTSTVHITWIFLFYRTILSCQEAEKVLIKIFNVNRQNFKSQSQIQLAK